MNDLLQALKASLTDPAALFGHFTYLLLIISMLMRTIVWLRLFATVAGVAKIVYRTVFVFDPVSVVWETLFVVVNLAELGFIWWQSRPPRLTAEERGLADAVGPNLPAAAIRALKAGAEWRDAEAGGVLTREGVPNGGLFYLASGEVEIAASGQRIGVCLPGDYIGEMTWIDGTPATATATALVPVRYAWFDRAALTVTLRKRAVLRFALQASISRNLVAKLLRATLRGPEAAAR